MPIPVDPSYLHVQDVNNDGRPEILAIEAQVMVLDYIRLTRLSVLDWDGNLLWQVGEPLESKYKVHGDVAFNIADIDGDGQTEILVTRDFEIQSTEVTQEQFEAVMGYNPSHFASCPACPVEMVNWHEAAAFCNTLSTTAGLSRCYECWGGSDEVNCTPTARYANPYDCPGYRLPTEAEWEYAVRSGDTMATYNGELDVSGCVPSPVLAPIAWYCGNSDSTPHPVGDLDPNAWGLYDMLGSVFEWCHDWYRAYPSGSLTDPWGPLTGSERILRGGSWRYHAQRVRAADRGRGTSVHAGWDHIGFRPARTMP